jgi:thiamine pyrophosphokinase
MPAEGSHQSIKLPSSGKEEGIFLKAVIIANGELNNSPQLEAGDLLIAADGGARHCLRLGLKPHLVIGDFDSLDPHELATLQQAGAEIVRHPPRKDATDLELALLVARERGATQAIVLGALGARWDQTVANLLLPLASGLAGMPVRLLDGEQELLLLRTADPLLPAEIEVHGQPGDTVSLIPLSGDAQGVRTQGLEYPLHAETLFFGATRGVSNVLIAKDATISLQSGILLIVLIHAPSEGGN